MSQDTRPISEQTATLNDLRQRMTDVLGADLIVVTWISGDTLTAAVRRKEGRPGRDPIYVDGMFVEVRMSDCGPMPAPDLRAAEILFPIIEQTKLMGALDDKTLIQYLADRQRFVERDALS
ncbi:hypothetical protein [Paraburkholderia sp. SIMBA_054]|uniref:hypothetical protein n=1 Tax=Paraburkholderia sp. SIMBA_054 TaxID=3085795 RepID=UPI00397A0ED4